MASDNPQYTDGKDDWQYMWDSIAGGLKNAKNAVLGSDADHQAAYDAAAATMPKTLEDLSTATKPEGQEDAATTGAFPVPAAELAAGQKQGPVATTGTNPVAESPVKALLASTSASGDDDSSDDDSDGSRNPASSNPNLVSTTPGLKLASNSLSGIDLSKLPGGDSFVGPTQPGQIGNPLDASNPQAVAQNGLKDIYGKGNSDDDLKALQQKQLDMMKMAGVMRGADQISQGFSRGAYKPDESYYEDLVKQAGVPVQQLMQRRQAQDQAMEHQLKGYQVATAQQKADAGSQASKIAQEYVKKMGEMTGMQVDPTGASALQLEAIYGPMEKIAAAMQRRQAIQAQLGLKQAIMGQNNNLKYEAMLGKALDPNQQRSGTPMSQSQQVINNSEALSTLVNQYGGDIEAMNKINPQMATEATQALNRLVTRGNPNVETFKHMVPNGGMLTLAQIAQVFKNQPVGAGQGAFLKNMNDTAMRERALAEEQLRQAQLRAAYSGFGNSFRAMNPTGFNQGLYNATGIDPQALAQYDKDKDFNKIRTYLHARAAQDAGNPSLNAEQQAGAAAGKQPPNGHWQVQQGEHTYQWNPQTGQYE